MVQFKENACETDHELFFPLNYFSKMLHGHYKLDMHVSRYLYYKSLISKYKLTLSNST